jgi:sugar O-acyltransferase (sialic acid O-acetyltransferase NeuD family)
MIEFYNKIALIGNGGFGREVYYHMINDGIDKNYIEFFDDNNINCKKISDLDIKKFKVLVTVAEPEIREQIVKRLPSETQFYTYIHSSAKILDENIKIGHGSIICAGSILTTNITIGRHAHINLNTTIGHDCMIGDFFTTTPNVNISGNCILMDKIYLGTNSTIREKIKICSNVKIGMNSGVIKNVEESGTYIGTPLKKIK